MTMDEFGEHLKMQHQNFMLNFLDSGESVKPNLRLERPRPAASAVNGGS